MYHRDDSFKPVKSLSEARFCGQSLAAWLAARGLTPQELGLRADGPVDLWELPLFWEDPTAADIQGFVDSARADAAWRDKFRASARRSLRFLHNQADLVLREADRERIRSELIRESILSGQGWQTLPAQEMGRVFDAEADRAELEALAEAEQDDLIAVYRRHCLASLSGLSGRTVPAIAVEYLSSLTTPPTLSRSVKSDQIVWARCPVRMDFGGGWTDTPPYTLREGGRVTNVAIDLNGQAPIQVFCRPLDKPVVRFHSIDLGEGEEIRSFQALEDYTNPLVPFALPRAALCILGFTQACHPGKTLADALAALGGGVEVTLLSAIPKGSGLGVSSILGATVLAALERFFGVFDPDHGDTGELYRQVLQMEQMLTTGGGWQDQIGGVAGGIKYLVGTPGLRPELAVYRLDPHLFLDPECTGRYTLFYTGVTRLAKNILQEVVDQCNSMSPAYLFTLRRIGALAEAAREAFALRDADRFARIVEMSWMENCLIHPSTTNPEISAMRKAVAPYYRGMKLLGAGGGGYAFFVSDDADSALRLRDALEGWAASAGNPRARVVDMALNQAGLQVTVS